MRFSVEAITAEQTLARTRFKSGMYLLVLAASCISSSAETKQPGPAQVRFHLQRADAALKAKDTETATKEFHAVLALDPRNAAAHVSLGVIAFSQSDYEKASEHLRQALAVRPSIAQAQALLGICERRLGSKSAQAQLESSFSKLADAPLRTQVGMELIGLYYQQGDSERAVPVVQKLVALNPDDVNILYMAQRLYRELADDTLNKLAVLAPGSGRMQQVIAERLINAGDLSAAIEHFKRALEIDPRIPGVHYELAQAIVESASGDPVARDEAEKELVAAVASDGDSSKIQCQLGRIALLRSDVQKAYAHYTQAFALDPGDLQSQLGLGRVFMTMERYQDARKYLEMAVKSDPLNATAHYRLAAVYKHLQLNGDAQREMQLYQEIKKTMDQVRTLYRQMKAQNTLQADDAPDGDR
jgi:tetratricopeptide (TPR) repeat protein